MQETQRCGFDPWVGKIPGEGHGNPLQYSCLENPTDRGAWRAAVHGVTKSWTRLSHNTHAWWVFLPRKRSDWGVERTFLLGTPPGPPVTSRLDLRRPRWLPSVTTFSIFGEQTYSHPATVALLSEQLCGDLEAKGEKMVPSSAQALKNKRCSKHAFLASPTGPASVCC